MLIEIKTGRGGNRPLCSAARAFAPRAPEIGKRLTCLATYPPWGRTFILRHGYLPFWQLLCVLASHLLVVNARFYAVLQSSLSKALSRTRSNAHGPFLRGYIRNFSHLSLFIVLVCSFACMAVAILFCDRICLPHTLFAQMLAELSDASWIVHWGGLVNAVNWHDILHFSLNTVAQSQCCWPHQSLWRAIRNNWMLDVLVLHAAPYLMMMWLPQSWHMYIRSANLRKCSDTTKLSSFFLPSEMILEWRLGVVALKV